MEEELKTNSVSALCFMSDHEGFHGTIKNSTRDFVVTEISINGQLVNEERAVENVSHQLPDNSGQTCVSEGSTKEENVKPLLTDNSIREETVSKLEGGDDGASQNADIGAACVEPVCLAVVLGPAVNEALEQFAASGRQRSEPRLDETVARTGLSLGTFPEKHQRAIVHRAVRHNFPFLMTFTNGTEVLVKDDPDYDAFARLVSEEEAEGFFRFIDAKVPNALFTFERDDCKAHRKAVHHFLSKRFGKLVETKSFGDVGSRGKQSTAITVRFRERQKPAKKRTAADCQEEGAKYTGFTLKKENLETLEAINYMATFLGVLPSDFTYAGIKDKRALTYQSMVVKKISPEWYCTQ